MNALGKNPSENTDNASILVKMENGSTGVVNYFANGSKSYAKERLEVFSQEKTLIMDNFIKTTGYGTKGFSKFKTKLDKGHKAQFGLIIERNGVSQVLVRQVPAILPNIDISGFTKTIAENIHIFDDIEHLKDTIDAVWGNIACHTSIRAGREMKIEEMNDLLREIERNPLAGQCNHGRPTFVKLDFKDIEKIFERI